MDCIQLSLFGKTYQEHSAPTEEKISEPCWKNLPAWNNQTLQFLDLRRGADGTKPEQLQETDGLWLGDSLTLNIGESPKEESVSLLSQILEVNVPQKYYLSARACQGILTRASRRGKPLPDILRQALMDVIGGGNSYTLKIRSGCAGGGKGALVQTEKSATLSTLQDQTLFQPIPVLNDQGGSVMDVSYDVTGTLRAQEHGHQPIVFDARGNGDGKIVPTITGDHENRITDYTAIAIERKTFNEQSFSHYKESDKCSTLKAKAGNIGNGSECLIAEKHDSSKADGVQTKPFCAGFSYKVGAKAMGIGYEIEKAGTLSAERHDSAVLEKTIRWIVRRLTPVECERLQGYPDDYTNIGDWTDSKGKKHKYADNPRYKALGNSIALPQWFWLVQKMRPYLKEKPTLGSLFDGLGGFPLVWQRAYGDGTARWASEIEEFPMAVTKRRFGEE
jgi:DNA (cytosine-5)-methyltransferase 1